MSDDAATPPGPAERSGPERIRALAHPVRLEILDILDRLGEATATECAQRTGQTVANCSFHLRTLAKYGFVEEAERRGRQRPWRPAPGGYDLRPDVGSSDAVRAADELALLTLERETRRLHAYYAHAHATPARWREAASMLTEVVWATPGELAELADDVAARVARLARRAPADRPAGARPANVLAVLTPDTHAD
ncbi:MAG TPA: helix-turn-helix domain-containing protein [Actinotalea caeni]|uniref:ArsR/SmtB family transcription factor n=1 Tax=Actinotalea caeni TaxID=1348467 RepID=UPI002B4AE55F|nr:helix-turn-helix domain-containing protein [Actinotalea caeni]HLV54307.1 helix-turn-helix domain-containing protein [Actinotalea caeni]